MSDPEIVCGPVLRRATPTAVSVFLALRVARKVTVRVYAGEGSGGVGTTVVQEGTAQTVRLGERLHVVTVTTAVAGSAGAVAPGADVRYQVFLGTADGTATPVGEGAATLFSPGVLAAASSGRDAVSYDLPGRVLPGFQVAPDDPALLRVLHGGDRGPDGEGRDALVTADRLVENALTDPATGPRPHLLVLTGDQVRTDDCSAFLLALVRATAAKWGLVHDPLPGLVDTEQPAVLGPHRRAELARRIGLRTTNNHLLSFAEHVATHLLALSDAAWPDLPAVEAVHPDLDWTRLPAELRAKIAAGTPFTTPPALEGEVALYTAYLRARERAVAFQTSLRAARRALANTPVLTTMGEHDAAPGWNASRAAAARLVGNAAGRRVLANALAANAVVHAWGDTPEQFETGRPGAQLLDRLGTWLAAPVPAAAGAQVDELVGVPSTALARPAGALTYTWALTRDRWQLLVLDTQTDRGYPAAAADAPAPLRDQSVVAALGLLPAPTATTLTVVASSVPLLLTQPKEWADPTVRPYSWSSNPTALHHVMTKLTTEKVPSTANTRTRRVVVLSGGQQHASAARLRFSAKAPAYGSGTDAVEAVVGQVTAAPLRYTTPLGRRLHLQGYDSHAVVAPWRDFVGWDQTYTTGTSPAQRPLPVGVHYTGADRTPAPWTITPKPQLAEVTPDDFLQLSPQWAWRTEYLRSALAVPPDPGELLEVEPLHAPWENAVEEDAATPVTPAAAPPAWNLARFRQAAHNHRNHRTWWAAGTELVGENALGDLTFATVPTDAPATVPPPVPGAVATVEAAQWWWADDGKGLARRTRFDVRLDPGWGWYDGDRYGGRALRRGDFDARPGVQASYWGVRQNAGTHVADLQRDLVELGFAMAGRDQAGRFEHHTQWAVREFQIYARFANGVREKTYTGTAPARYVDRLERVTIPSDELFDRPEDKVTGVVDRNTRRLIGKWVAERRRCPVVIEAMSVVGGNPTPPTAARGNLWHHTEPGPGGPRVYATDFTGRYTVGAGDTVAQPASTDPAGGPDQRPGLVVLSAWANGITVLVQRASKASDPLPHQPRIEATTDGGQLSTPNTMWTRLEMKPETMLTGNPTVAALVADIANPAGVDQAARDAARLTARRRLSTYKVIRAVAEVEAIGFFDGINGYDNAFLSMGPCHWTMGKLIQVPPVPALANPPALHTITVDKDWSVEDGEFWGYLALLENMYPQVFHDCFGRDGIRPARRWADTWSGGGRKYSSYATLTDDLAPRQLPAKVREYDYFHSWHNFYRMLMAVRTVDDVRRAMYRLAAQRICDGLAADWPQGPTTGPNAEPVPPNTTPPGGTARRPRIGEMISSEWGVALLYRWHILSPSGLFGAPGVTSHLRPAYAFARAGECGVCTATADKRHPIDPWSPNGGPRVDPGWTTDPATWTDAHEHALVAGIVHRANHHTTDTNMTNTINTVRGWPSWFGGANPSHFTLEIAHLPVPGGAGVDPAVFPVSERQLKHERGSFLLDSAGLPYPNGRAHTPAGGTP
jgi:hypothetical protein